MRYSSSERKPVPLYAAFDSTCPGCDEDIEEGDVIVMIDGVAVCEGCGDE